MTLHITTLVENAPCEHKNLRHEHGLSFHVRVNGRELLFDAGSSDALLHNAGQLRIGLDALDYVVLSHGHYDHTGGFQDLAEQRSGFSLVTGRNFFAEKYGERGVLLDYLGNSFDPGFLQKKSIPHEEVGDPGNKPTVRELLPGAYVVTGFERTHSDETVNPRFVLRDDAGRITPDAFDDEILLALDSPRGLVALLGCSHPGVKNMLETTRKLLDRPLYAVLGGTHLVESSPQSVEMTRQYLLDAGVQLIAVSHCTGQNGMDCLSSLGERYAHNCTGSGLIVTE